MGYARQTVLASLLRFIEQHARYFWLNFLDCRLRFSDFFFASLTLTNKHRVIRSRNCRDSVGYNCLQQLPNAGEQFFNIAGLFIAIVGLFDFIRLGFCASVYMALCAVDVFVGNV